MFTPDAVGGKGRPYPYMIFRNLETLGIASVADAAKVGDTVSDIKEGTSASLYTVGVIEGSSELALTQDEFESLNAAERAQACERVERTFREAGADAVIQNLAELPALLRQVR